jgi:hypothetical protein
MDDEIQDASNRAACDLFGHMPVPKIDDADAEGLRPVVMECQRCHELLL